MNTYCFGSTWKKRSRKKIFVAICIPIPTTYLFLVPGNELSRVVFGLQFIVYLYPEEPRMTKSLIGSYSIISNA